MLNTVPHVMVTNVTENHNYAPFIYSAQRWSNGPNVDDFFTATAATNEVNKTQAKIRFIQNSFLPPLF